MQIHTVHSVNRYHYTKNNFWRINWTTNVFALFMLTKW